MKTNVLVMKSEVLNSFHLFIKSLSWRYSFCLTFQHSPHCAHCALNFKFPAPHPSMTKELQQPHSKAIITQFAKQGTHSIILLIQCLFVHNANSAQSSIKMILSPKDFITIAKYVFDNSTVQKHPFFEDFTRLFRTTLPNNISKTDPQ